MKGTVKRLMLAIIGVGLVAGTAWAGAKYPEPVYISTAYSYAIGSMGSARNSSDSSQEIGCVTYNGGGTQIYGYCFAEDASNNYKQCSWSGTQWTQTINAMTDSSYVWFEWDGSGNCTLIVISNDSAYTPPVP
ncbi:MAG TPA: hypothetical protein VKZ18_00415 [Polyangia bacterium]|nr:hypothetical protein [Polyangia bacterium]